MHNLKENSLYVEGNPLDGTIIDLETIGSIRNEFRDTRRYEKVKPYLFGYLNGNTIVQKYVEKPDHIPELVQWIQKAILTNLFQEPLYAFFTEFEIGVIYCATGIKVNFEKQRGQVFILDRNRQIGTSGTSYNKFLFSGLDNWDRW